MQPEWGGMLTSFSTAPVPPTGQAMVLASCFFSETWPFSLTPPIIWVVLALSEHVEGQGVCGYKIQNI